MNQVQLDKILLAHQEWLLDPKKGSRADLMGAELKGANLSGANLLRGDLLSANLSGANLSEANLAKADLTGVNFNGANLSRANLYEANLSRANLYEANLYVANFREANLTEANLYKTNLRGTNLSGATLFGAQGIIDAGQDLRGYRFIGVYSSEGIRILAGCRWFSLERAERHWKIKNNADALYLVKRIASWGERIIPLYDRNIEIEIFDEKSG